MKCLHLSDLHLTSRTPPYAKQWIKDTIANTSPDVIVSTGDTFEYMLDSPNRLLKELFGDIQTIITLGNHEFFQQTPKMVIDFVQEEFKDSDIKILDLVGHVDIGEWRFVGNVLWYDGSLSIVEGQDLDDFAENHWADRLIHDFDWKALNAQCVEQIRRHHGKHKRNILCTHTVPQRELNGHLNAYEVYDYYGKLYIAYSGMSSLIEDLHQEGKCFEYSLSGHTHKRVVGLEICGCKCINVGNDYYPPFEYFLLDLEERS